MMIFDDIALCAPNIMLPNDTVDLNKWAVIACDQYTSEPEYWKQIENQIADAPSALRGILPEVYLGIETQEQIDNRLAMINKSINDYLNNNIWQTLNDGFIVLNRQTSIHPTRLGLMVAIDLEQYSYEPGNKELIRATEGTVISRIPPRVKIRANSPVEMPHIMLLIDDPTHLVIKKAWETMASKHSKPCYDTELLAGSGHVTGYFIDKSNEVFDGIIDGFRELLRNSNDNLLFAVGDGNHSLASAKAHWDNIKQNLSEELKITHPARYALAEVVNIHDEGLDFEPIHRVVFGMEREEFLEVATDFFAKNNSKLEVLCDTSKVSDFTQHFILINDKKEDLLCGISNPISSLTVGSVQALLDYLCEQCDISVDYIHGTSTVKQLSSSGNTGIILPDVSKNTFFDTISKDGVFPRKTFSMGEAFEKRFYLEAKMITK